MDNNFEIQLESLRKMLAESSMNEKLANMYIERVKTRGYLDEETKAEIIDILNQENILLKNDLEVMKPESLEELASTAKELGQMEDEGEKLMQKKAAFQNLKDEIVSVAKSELSEEEKNQKYDQIKAKYEEIFKF